MMYQLALRLRRALDTLFFPNRCLSCRALIPRAAWLCESCAKKLERRGEPRITVPGQPFTLAAAPFQYNKTGRRALLNYKFHGRHAASDYFANETLKTLQAYTLPSLDCVTWTPLHVLRFRERGYDQARLIAMGIARGLELPCVRLLVKRRRTKRQSGLHDETARRANVQNAYRASPRVAGKRVLLVDDVWTTGSTTLECCWTLLGAGAREVVCAAAFSAERE